jgi:hypothetical protein
MPRALTRAPRRAGTALRTRRLVVAAIVVTAAALPAPALAFHHGGVPADECAPTQAGTPGNNPVANAAVDKNHSLPIAPVNTPGNDATPATCPPE